MFKPVQVFRDGGLGDANGACKVFGSLLFGIFLDQFAEHYQSVELAEGCNHGDCRSFIGLRLIVHSNASQYIIMLRYNYVDIASTHKIMGHSWAKAVRSVKLN